MAKNYPRLNQAMATRRATLSLVEGLDQSQIDFRPTQRWSLGQVLDHLVKIDDIYLKELEDLAAAARKGRPFLYRSMARFVDLPKPLSTVLPFFELPFDMVNSVIPTSLRRRIFNDRRVPAQAPSALEPLAGRPIADLRSDLQRYLETLERMSRAEDLNLERLCYYNPIVGLTRFPGAVRFVERHEQRHQGQIRDILDDTTFPAQAA